MNTIFHDIFDAGKESDQIALIYNDVETTYRSLLQSSLTFANLLASRLPRRPIVAISANHSLAYVEGLLACIALNAIIVPINPSSTLSEKLHVLDNSSADALLLEKGESYWGNKCVSGHDLELYLTPTPSKARSLPEGSRMLIYTSGTTSKPKGVLLSDRSLSSNVRAVANNFGLSPGDRTIVFSPPAYAMAMTQIFSYLWAGGSIVCWAHGLRYPAEIVRIVEAYKPSGLTLSPSAARIVKKAVMLEGKSFSSPRYVSSGGMPLYAKDIIWYREKFPNARVVNFYGCTENSPRVSHYWVPLHFDATSDIPLPVGQALEGVEIMISDNHGDAVPPNTVGEIYLNGSSLMESYWHNDEFTALKFHKNWFKTGDSGFIDSTGNLNLSGRVDNVFSVGHEKIAPEEIEALIARTHGVEEVVVCRIVDALLDFVPAALIVGKGDLSKIRKDVLDQCRENLSTAKIPREVLFVDEVPRTQYGKIDRKSSQILIKTLIEKNNG